MIFHGLQRLSECAGVIDICCFALWLQKEQNIHMKLSAAFLLLCIPVSALSGGDSQSASLPAYNRTAASLIRLNLCYNEDFIESPDCVFEVIVAHAYDNIKLAGALVNHFYINMCMSKG